MSKIPKAPDKIFQEFTNDYKNTFGDDLVSIILYGSAARGEYVYKRSDINFLIVLSDKGIQRLRSAFSLIPKWNKKKVTTPLILTQQYIQSALDSYSIEFLAMKQHYQLVYGEDVLSELEIKPEHLRLQCERELRGKLLYLREGYLNTNGKIKLIKQLFKLSVPAFTSIFLALLYLKDVAVPNFKQQIFITTADVFDLDGEVFKNLLKIENKTTKFKKEQINQLMEQYIGQISKLTKIVDKL